MITITSVEEMIMTDCLEVAFQYSARVSIITISLSWRTLSNGAFSSAYTSFDMHRLCVREKELTFNVSLTIFTTKLLFYNETIRKEKKKKIMTVRDSSEVARRMRIVCYNTQL